MAITNYYILSLVSDDTMAFIRAANIAEIHYTILPERTHEDATIDDTVRFVYEQRGYAALPKTKEEAAARGVKGFNGLAVSAPRLVVDRIRNDTNDEELDIDLAPTRYLLRDAMAGYVKECQIIDHDVLGSISPRIVGVSIITPIEFNGQYCFVSQIKGDALGEGEIHAGYAAGGLIADDLTIFENPFRSAIKRQVKDEMGLDRDRLDITPGFYLFDERETGQVNLGSIVRGFDFDQARATFERDTMAKIAAGKTKLEVNGFAPIPVAGLAIVPIEKGRAGLADVHCYLATPNGLVETIENRGVRPYTEALVAHLAADKRNLTRFRERAGL